MKNALTPSQGTAAVSEPWRAALRTFDADLQRRGAAERTRKAYGTDAAELAAWATANGLDAHRGRLQGAAALGRAPVAEGRRAAHDGAQARVARAASSAACSSTARSAPTRPTCCPRRSSRSSLPKTLKAAGHRALLDKIPASHAARTARPRAVRAGVLVRSERRGARRSRRRSRSSSTASRCASRARDPRRASSPSASPRCGRSPPIWSAPARRCSQPRPDPALFLVQERAAALARATSGADCGYGRGMPPPRPACTRTPCGTPSPPICWTAARTCARSRTMLGSREYLDDPGLHSGRVRPAPGGVREEPPAGLREGPPGDQRQSDRAEGAVDRLQDRRLRPGTRTARRRLLTTRQVRRRPHVLRACPRTSKRPT